MKTRLKYSFRFVAVMVLTGRLLAQPTPVGGPAAATQTEVDAGTVSNKYVSPLTLSNWTGAATYTAGAGLSLSVGNEFSVAAAQTTITSITSPGALTLATSANGDINLTPNGTGVVAIGAITISASFNILNLASGQFRSDNSYFTGGSGFRIGSDIPYAWSSGNGLNTAADTALARNAAGVVEINNGTPGTYRDLKLRNLIAGDGSEGSPSIRFDSDPDTGIFWSGVGNLAGLSAGGSAVAYWGTGGIYVGNGKSLLFGGSADANFSYLGAASIALGDGNAGDFSGSLKLRNLTTSGYIESPTGVDLSFANAGTILWQIDQTTGALRGYAGNAYPLSSGALTIGGGTAIAKVLSATATLDFGSTGSGAVADLTITVTGAATGDTVAIGVPNGSVTATASYIGWVSSSNTVTVRFSPKATEDPASGTFRATVVQF